MNNPLLKEFKNEYGIPPFESIKEEHYLTAFDSIVRLLNDRVSCCIILGIVDAFPGRESCLMHCYLTINNIELSKAIHGVSVRIDLERIHIVIIDSFL